MSDFDLYAFEPGQQVQCKTRFDDVYKGQVIAFDMPSRILILKSSPSSGVQGNHDLHFLVLDSISDVQILEEPRGDCAKDQLPSIEMKYVESKMKQAKAERLRLLEAVGNGCSQEGIQLYTELSKKYDRASDIEWKDKVKIVVMNTVVINPPYSEADCKPLTPNTQKEAVAYVKSNVRKFWDSCAKQKQQQQQQQQQAQQQTQPLQQAHPQAQK
uniref:Protein LSM12 n=1 Tax=Aceria tosichella TaxID=561515 RepID=A0A6G1SHG4_9ACAR